MDITTQYEPTVAEIRDSLIHNMAKPRRAWWYSMAIGILGGTGVLLMGVLATSGPAIATLQVIIGLVLVVFGAWHLMLLRSGAKLATDRSAARLCGPTTLRMSSDRYGFELPSEKGEVLWELTRVVVSRDAWTFALNNRVNLIVPKRALSAEDQVTFAAFLANRDRKLVRIA